MNGRKNVCSIESFPFKKQPGISRRQIQELAELEFIPRAENIVFIGQTGVGKTGIASGLLLKALQNGFPTPPLGIAVAIHTFPRNSDKIFLLASNPVPNPVSWVGHSKKAQGGHFCRAPKRKTQGELRNNKSDRPTSARADSPRFYRFYSEVV
jgi:hypothetical protein